MPSLSKAFIKDLVASSQISSLPIDFAGLVETNISKSLKPKSLYTDK